jgi:acetyl-CoA C-acetyltransferase
MNKRVAVCAVAQIKNEPDIWYQRFQGMLFDCFESIIKQTGVTFDLEKGIRNIVTCSDDVFDARTISDNGMTDVVGAHYRGEEKTAQDGINALGYGMACILSGHDDLILVLGHCKESQSESRQMCTNLAFDPFYCRPLGLDYLNASALQARAYMQKSGVTEEQLAKVVVRSRECGAKNSFARDNDSLTEKDVMASPMVSDPVRELHQYPVTDWSVGMLLCCEERAREFTDKPVWLTGFGSTMDSYFLGDRDLVSNFALKKAAEKAYKMAGVKNPVDEFDVVELNDAYAYQMPMWAEGLGMAEEGKGGQWIDDSGMEKQNVNLSGGMLNGNPLLLGGLARTLECVLQLRGEAEKRQVVGAAKAVAHGTTGAAGQHHAVITLEK